MGEAASVMDPAQRSATLSAEPGVLVWDYRLWLTSLRGVQYGVVIVVSGECDMAEGS